MADVQKLGVSCSDPARSEPCESVYPIDATPSSMTMCFDDIGDLLYLTEGELARPFILFLSSNSDLSKINVRVFTDIGPI